MSFLSLVLHNITVKKVRSALIAIAVAVGVSAVVTLGLVNHGVQASAVALMQTGRADFTVAQSGVSDILDSNIQQADLQRIRTTPGVTHAVGVLITTVGLDKADPAFLELGVPTEDLSAFDLDLQGMEVRSVTVEGRDARFNRAGQELTVRPHDGRLSVRV